MKFHFVFSVSLFLAPLFFLSAGCVYTSISTRHHQVVFRYVTGSRSEKDLPTCDPNSVCSVLHNRFWLPAVAERLCRCPTNEECPWKWADSLDNQTMLLNNRAQLKFCTQVNNRDKCRSKISALTTERSTGSDNTFTMKISCFCPANHHWKHYKTIQHFEPSTGDAKEINEYKCWPLKRCSSLEFCGYVRSDFNSIYYSCSCPKGHFCVNRDKVKVEVDVLMYKGAAFRAVCEPITTNDFDY